MLRVQRLQFRICALSSAYATMSIITPGMTDVSKLAADSVAQDRRTKLVRVLVCVCVCDQLHVSSMSSPSDV